MSPEERYVHVRMPADFITYPLRAARFEESGGPLYHERADDSEAAAAMADALTRGWRALGDPALLSMAEDAAQILASWVVSCEAPFPPGSTLFGRNPCGGVIANVQNRHIGPGIATNSGRFLRDLAAGTGNRFSAEMYENILSAAIGFLVTEDGGLMGYDRDTGTWYPCRQGLLIEQVNLTDSLNEPGEVWAVSAGWPAAFLLLAWAEQDE